MPGQIIRPTRIGGATAAEQSANASHPLRRKRDQAEGARPAARPPYPPIDPTPVIDALDRLAAVVQRTTDPDDDTGWYPAAIDAARDALETVAGLDAAEVKLRYDAAIALAGELQQAADGTFTAHTRGAVA
ncbi:hypothetical protein ACH4VR_41270 [Streptomyces sp. NPDC020883]|uniref:hypothetical protein n=1 Tax=Streptomyces sp. NPDC020883 TaxID=3365099 RepID=UPI0037AE5411